MGRERDNPHQSQRNVVSNHHGHPVISEGSARRGDLLCERRSVEKALQRRVHVARVAQVGEAHQAPRHGPGRPLAPLPPGWKFNRKFGLRFGLKNGLRFSFDSVICLNYPFFELVFSVGNLKPKLKWFFEPQLLLLNCHPVAVLSGIGGGLVGAAPGRRAYERAEAAGLLPNPHLVVASN